MAVVLQNIKDKVYEMFARGSIDRDKINFYVNTIVLEFADDFPEFKSYLIDSVNTTGNLKIDVKNIDNNFLKPIGYIKTGRQLNKIIEYYPGILEHKTFNEFVTVTLYSRMNLFSLQQTNLIVPIMDSTDMLDITNQQYTRKDYVIIPSNHLPALLFYTARRNVLPILRWGYKIDEQIFPILESFIIYKIIDYLFLEDLEQVNNKIMDILDKNQDLIERLDSTGDTTVDDLVISSVNLGGVSISYDGSYKTKVISEAVDTLDRMAKNIRGLLDSYRNYYDKIRQEKYNFYNNSKKMYILGTLLFV